MTDPTDDGSELHRQRSLDATPLPRRMGRLSMIFLAIVVAGLLASWALKDGESLLLPAEGGTVFDVESFPTGALGGQPAPLISFSLFDGSRFDLAEHFASDGRPVVLNFWASWCFPCRTEMPEFSEVAIANPTVAFFGVAVDDGRQSALAFAEEIGVAYPLGVDEDNTVASNYPYIGLPTTYLIAADGTVTHQIQGQITGEALQAFIDFDFTG